MAYLQDNTYFGSSRRNKTHPIRYVVLVLLIIGFFFLFRQILNSFSYSIAVPLLEAGTMAERGAYSAVHSKSELLRHIESLESENAELHTKLIGYSLIENENSGFKNSAAANLTGTIATVVARPSKTAYDTLLIKTDFPVTVGMHAHTLSGVPLGTVTNVSESGSTVSLYSTPGNEIDADIILSDAMDSITTKLRGRGGGAFEAITSKDVVIPIGALVSKPSVSGKPFAEVVKIAVRDDTKDQLVYFRSVVNFQHVRYIVLTP